MSDNLSKEVRSYNMSRIRNKDTTAEEKVRKHLFSQGLRYRKNDKRYPGHPDIVLPKYKVIIFVNGCFWHKHDGCPYFVWPKSNVEYWRPKLEKNQQHDREVYKRLTEMGWRVIVIWECELKSKVKKATLERLYNDITKLPIASCENQE
ncbi:very short patch repair endonuclease [Dehalobacter sp.]|uniref:very short patch repair endonuclease n=1 Tax=Dehalobacter sp. TaxID=1962289 RepID=UPI00258C4776|nr:very short patch repair endonuclease [Dehalobacter sp.]MDJ0305105.1 very short patch repair endonuclease [Dehalobacter sp.]